MELEADPKDTACLKHLAQACEKYLRKLSQDEEAQEDIAKAREGYWASRQFAEFNVWCAKVGVNGEGLRSIDVRLKDVPEICELLRHLLQSLERDLNELQQPAEVPAEISNTDNNLDDVEVDASSLSFKSLSSSEGSKEQSATGDVASPWRERNLALRRHIGDTIDRLHGHARRVECAGAKRRRERVEVYREKEGPKWAYEGFKKLATWKANEEFKLASDTIRQRFAESFARRRIRFEYLKEHQKKRAVDTGVQEQNSPPEPQLKGGGGSASLVKKQEAQKRANTVRRRLQDPHTICSATENTKLDRRPEPSWRERAESVASVELRHPGFPPPPKTCGGSFQCPFCRLEFRAREAESDRWSQHVMQDFEPYFCTFEDCKAPFDVPNTFDGLLGHLQDHLPVRYHVDMPDGEHKEFDETEFEEHVNRDGEISEEVLATMKEASRRKGTFLFESCPFCGGYPDVLKKPLPDTPEAQTELRKHIKQHMQDIALFLPPYREDIFNEDDLKSSAVTRRRSVNRSDTGEDECKTVCDRQGCDCKDKGKYAAEDALAAESMAEAELAPDPEAEEDADSWPELLGDSLYNRSSVSDDYYLSDECLQPFITRLEPEPPSSGRRTRSPVPVYTAVADAKIVVSGNRFQTSQNGCWMVPFKRNPRFLDRHNRIVELEQKVLSNNDKLRKMAITGVGGVGKTQIALEVAYRVRDRKPECSIFWIPSTSIEMIEQAYVSIGKCLGLQGVTLAEMKMRVKAHLSSEKAGPWLLIVDNMDNKNIWLTSDGGTYLPQSKYGFVLFTTRNRRLATKLVGLDVINISGMDDGMAIDLLRASLVHKDLTNDSQTTTQLLHQLGCLPLAIVQAASYMNETGTSVTTYLSLLQSQENVIVELLSQDFEDEWRYLKTNNSVAVTWLISFNQIQRSNPLAADYLLFMSCIDPQDIPLSLLPPNSSQIKQQNALGLLKAYSFITGQADGQTVSLHRLVHVATRNWLRSGEMLEQWTVNTGRRLRDIFPSNEPENRILWREYLPHALFILRSEEFQNDKQDREYLVQRVAKCLYKDGRYDQAGTLFKEARKTVLGPEHPDTLTSMNNLALTYQKQGRWTAAEMLLVQVIEARKTVLGPEHPDTLTSMNNLALTYQKQGRWMEVEKLFVQVMETRKMVLGPEHPNTLASMNNLALTYQNQGRWTEAEKLLVQVIEARKTVLGPEHPDTLTSMNNFALTYQNQGRWTEVEKLFVQVMETRKMVLGPEHPSTLTSMNNLALTYQNQGRWTEAEKLFVQVMETRKMVLGPEHPNTLTSMNNLALTYQNQGRWTEAEKLFVRVMETSKTVLGPEHPNTLTSMNNLALTYQRQGRWTELRRHDEALSMLQACVQLRNQLLGPSHPDTVAATATLKRWQSPSANSSRSSLSDAISSVFKPKKKK
ncbi:hypothetical protein V8E54_003325 [Elaphomyces granulatus]